MDPRLLEYYNQELVALAEIGGEFARTHPKVANRLGREAGESIDPYAERFIESFAFLAARMRIKMDTESSRCAARLLEVVYPNYTAPTPSMAVARFHPDPRVSELAEGFRIARGTALRSREAPGGKTACEFRTSQDVVLYPLEITSAAITGIPTDIPMLERYVPADTRVRGALRLRIRTSSQAGIAGLRGLDRLPICLAGDEHVASHLFELVHAASVVTLIRASSDPCNGAGTITAVTSDAVIYEGLGAEQGLLPLTWTSHHGHNLLREYFACPGRFYFLTLAGLASGFSRVQGSEVEVVVLLDQPGERLAELVDASRFALFCSPVINLFPSRTDRIELSRVDAEFHLVPRRLAPLDYEVFSVESLRGHLRGGSSTLEFRPLYQTLNMDHGNYGRYFSLRREPRMLSEERRRHGSRTHYSGTEAYVSLVDQHEPPYRADMHALSVDAWLTNRDLAPLVPRDGVNDLFADHSAPLASVGLIRPPSPPHPPFAERETIRRLVRLLNFSQLPLEDIDHRPGGQALRDMLRLFLPGGDVAHQRQIESLVGVKMRHASHKLPSKGPLVFGRGIECVLTVDETGFSGASPYLFGLVLEHYMTRHASINSFVQTELQSIQRGRVMRWPARMGARGSA
ncbi:type VI secretion system baseplate subunit TssF [Caballeronia ptereochthonis]|uniref:Type VI secretion protein n=1 Tax=Caballeronia ptereochthonis TaxID=1777144 RepID=A0A158A8Q5_9BURK|nr:type VI secretion system baseplate subunit TssF [Caballeronia ptereochthonis]SAK54198.1 type VI secretion protein [Caballeronia ptereochthonis]